MKRLLTTAKAKTVVNLLVLCALAVFALPANSYAATMPHEVLEAIKTNYPDGLPRYLTPEEQQWLAEHPEIEALEAPAVGPLAAPPAGTVHAPAEYEPVYGILVAWEPGSYTALLRDLVVGVTTDPNMNSLVFIVVLDASQEATCRSTLTSAGADLDRVRFIYYNLDTVWIRDYGPRYILGDNAPAIIDHKYNRTRVADDAFPTACQTSTVPFPLVEPLYHLGGNTDANSLIHGGGNFHCFSNGDGFSSTLVVDENPTRTQAEIIQLFHDYFNANETIYTRLPSSIDSTGHIDMWLLPLGNNKVLVSEFASGTGKTITDAGANDLISRGYTVYRTPAWFSSYHYTYTNATIVNKKVFISKFGGSYTSQDANALAVYTSAMPGYTITQLDCASIIQAAGAVHCVMKHVYLPTPWGEALKPNGGESLMPGQSYQIKWIANDDVGITSVDLYYSTNGGTSYPYTIATGEPHDGYYTWTVPNTPSTLCRIKVVVHDGDGHTAEDTSNANFTITAPDTTPPTPNPMTWATVPTATDSTTITMTATTATDATTPPVMYYFECTTDGSKSSSWQTSTTYVASGLTPSTLYSFRVKARDSAPALNETGWSSTLSATTLAPQVIFVAAGAVANSSSAITPALPSGIATGDILLLFLETANQGITISNSNGGTWY